MDIGHLPVEDVAFRDCTIWCDWGHALEIGAETFAPHINGILFQNIDIIRTSFVAMSILHGDGSPVRDVLYQDIRLGIDENTPSPVFQSSRGELYRDQGGFVPMLFEVLINKDMLWAQDDTLGDVDGVVYRNISVTGHAPASIVRGVNENHRVSGLTMENLLFNGKQINDSENAHITLEAFADPVVFVQ
jgi:hypothetical protein